MPARFGEDAGSDPTRRATSHQTITWSDRWRSAYSSTLSTLAAATIQKVTDQIAMTDTTAIQVFTATSAFSIAGVFGALAFAYVGLTWLLPKTASKTDKITFVWMVSDLACTRCHWGWNC